MPIRNDPDLFNVYSHRVEDTQIKIVPIVKRGGTEWRIRIFRDYQQGVLWEGKQLTLDVIEQYELPSISDEKIAEVNEATTWANRFLEYDTEFNRKERGQASVSDLYKMTSQGKLVDRLSD